MKYKQNKILIELEKALVWISTAMTFTQEKWGLYFCHGLTSLNYFSKFKYTTRQPLLLKIELTILGLQSSGDFFLRTCISRMESVQGYES